MSRKAQQYIREYLDPDGTLDNSPTSEDEARALWESLRDIHEKTGDNIGIDEETFVEAVAEMQEKFRTSDYPNNDHDSPAWACHTTFNDRWYIYYRGNMIASVSTIDQVRRIVDALNEEPDLERIEK